MSPPWRLLVPLWQPHLTQDQFCTTWGVQVGPELGVVVIRTPFQTKFQFCRVPRMGGIKLQLLCVVRIELAIGSLPYLALARYLSHTVQSRVSKQKKNLTDF